MIFVLFCFFFFKILFFIFILKFFLKFYIVVEGYFPLPVIVKYWLYFPCSITGYISMYIIPSSLCLPLLHPNLPLPPSPITTSLFYLWTNYLLFCYTLTMVLKWTLGPEEGRQPRVKSNVPQSDVTRREPGCFTGESTHSSDSEVSPGRSRRSSACSLVRKGRPGLQDPYQGSWACRWGASLAPGAGRWAVSWTWDAHFG